MANLYKSFIDSVKHWYIPLILGMLFIACGIYVFTVPLATYVTLSVMFSISFLVSGILDVFFSIQNHKTLNGWGWYLVTGILSLIMGFYLMANPEISIVILPFVVGFTVMFRSFSLLGIAFDLRDAGINEWGNLAIASVLGIFLSFLLFANPLFTGISLVTLTCITFIMIGFASIVLSFNLKKIKDYPSKLSSEMKAKINALQNEIREQMK